VRLFLVVLSVLVALAVWVWATGPGTTLWLAAGGWIFCAVVGRVTFLLLRQKGGDTDTGPGAPPETGQSEPPSTVIHPQRHQP
jgi:hypothetical protein